MDLYPAVDVQGGRVAHVRTGGGNASRPSVYGDDPVAAVAPLAAAGARWVHVVDLDRAYGRGDNALVIQAVLATRTAAIQVGGSLGDDVVARMLDWGAARVVLGCAAAATDPAVVGRLARRHGKERLAVAIEASAGRVTPRAGRAPAMAFLELADLVRDQGADTVVYTDVTRDGTMRGPDLDGARALAALGLRVVASGGIGTLDDLAAIRDAGLAGAVVGRALHEGRFTLAEALTCTGG